MAYLSRSFNISRVFTQKWSVNFKWVPCTPFSADKMQLLRDCEGIFTSKAFGLLMVGTMLSLMLLFAAYRWCSTIDYQGKTGLSAVWARCMGGGAGRPFTARETAIIMFTSNLLGVVSSRSLHFQFYVWYFHGLPFLLFQATRLPVLASLALMAGIEMAWNPWGTSDTSSVESSILLTLCHIALVVALWDGLKVGPGDQGAGAAKKLV